MKLVRHGAKGSEKPGLLDASGTIRDLSGVIPDLAGAALSPEGLAKLAALDPATLPAVGGNPRLGPPVAGITKYPPPSRSDQNATQLPSGDQLA